MPLCDNQHVPGGRKSPHIVPLFLGGAFFLLYLFTAPSEPMRTGDAAAMLRDAQQLARQGFHTPEDDYPDHRFSKYGLGQALLNLPVARIYGRAQRTITEDRIFASLAVTIVPAMTCAAIVVLFYLISGALGYAMPNGLLMATALGFGTMIWVYSQVPLSEPTITFCWLLAVLALLRHRQRDRWIWSAVAGAAIGYAVITKVVAVLTLPLFIAYWIQSMHRRSGSWTTHRMAREIVAFTAPLFLFAAIFLWYNHLRYGSIVRTGYGDGRDTAFGFNTPFLVGFFGLILSPGKGFFFYNPIALSGLLGARRFHGRHRPESLLIWGLLTVMTAVHAAWWAWHGDWSWGPRFLVAAGPLLLLCALPVSEHLFYSPRGNSKRVGRLVFGLLFGLSVFVQILGICFDHALYIRMVAKDLRPLGGGLYHVQRWPIRDDLALPHFVPEFSPLVVHWWMLRVAMLPDSVCREQVLRTPPWKSLNAQWAAEPVDPQLIHINFWWYHALFYQFGNRYKAVGLALVFLGGSLLLFQRLLRLGRETR